VEPAVPTKQAFEAYQRGWYKEAEHLVRSVIAQDPADLGARTLLAACLYKQGQFVEALEQVGRALELWPGEGDLELLRVIFTNALAEQLSFQRLCA
jgi:Flp pilus assembly protein TadD